MLRFTLSCLVFSSFVSLAGCSAATDGAEAGDPASQETTSAVKPRMCPMIYNPVCGKDGKTYSNVCFAGGENRVAYEGECIDPCAAVLCIYGTHCEAKGNHASCVPDPQITDPCATVKCASGYHCEAVQVQCITTPCDPVAECLPTLCADGACGPALGMPNTLCPDGVNYSGPTGNCLDYGGTCGWEVLSCP